MLQEKLEEVVNAIYTWCRFLQVYISDVTVALLNHNQFVL